MLKNILLLFFLFFIPDQGQAQQSSIKGRVTSTLSKEALPGASIILDGKAIAVTDADGNYSILVDSGKHELTFHFISFLDKSIQLQLKMNESLVLDVSLNESSRELDIVVVSAAKFEQKLEEVTVSMEVLKPKLIEERNTTSMDDALQHVAGVSIVDGQANIRGGSGWSYGAGSRVQILVDDLPQLTADANDTKWSFLPVENIEQIEVIKGASSVLFGSSALNGAINIRTAYPKAKPITKVNVFTGIYDHAEYEINDTTYHADWWRGIPQLYSGINFLHSRQIGRLDLVVGGNMFVDEGFRKGEHEARARINSNLRYRFKKIDGLSVGVNVNSMKTEGTLFFLWNSDTAGAYIPAANTLSDYTTYRTNVDPFITYFDKKGNTHKLRTRWFNTTNQNNTNQDSKADLYYGEYQYQHKFKNNLNITTGLVRQVSKVHSELYGDHEGNQTAAYLQGDYQWNRLTISLGGRVEQNKVDTVKDDWTPVFRCGLNFRALKATFLRASYGQGYRFPSIAEKFVRTAVGSLIIYPNHELTPEKGYSQEFGIRQLIKIRSWSAYLDIAAFENRYNNMMEFGFAQWGAFTDPSFGLGFKSLNVGDTRVRGIDLSMLAQGTLFGEIKSTWTAGYTYIEPRQLSYDSAYVAKVGESNYLGSDSSDVLKYRYTHLVKADVEFEWKRISVGLSLRYHSRMINIDKIFTSGFLDAGLGTNLGIKHYRDNRTKGDAIFDLRTSVRITKELRTSFIVKNLFNYIYMERPADMQPPRIFVIQLGLNF
jgi:iron complex outermembrane receptor protein